MVLFNYSTKEITAKIVYYGPGLCGKTTNLQFIYDNLPATINRGKMLSLATKTDRTLFFDFLPIDLGTIRGLRTRLQLYTVPGQVFYNTTRKLVLKGADGVVFVADSQKRMADANLESFRNLEENLAEHGMKIAEMPLILQFNKRDLPDVLTLDQMNSALNRFNAPIYEAVATTGIGVHETLRAATRLVLNSLKERYAEKREDRVEPSVQAAALAAAQQKRAARPAPAPSAAPVPAHLFETQTAETPASPAPAPAAAGRMSQAAGVSPDLRPPAAPPSVPDSDPFGSSDAIDLGPVEDDDPIRLDPGRDDSPLERALAGVDALALDPAGDDSPLPLALTDEAPALDADGDDPFTLELADDEPLALDLAEEPPAPAYGLLTEELPEDPETVDAAPIPLAMSDVIAEEIPAEPAPEDAAPFADEAASIALDLDDANPAPFTLDTEGSGGPEPVPPAAPIDDSFSFPVSALEAEAGEEAPLGVALAGDESADAESFDDLLVPVASPPEALAAAMDGDDPAPLELVLDDPHDDVLGFEPSMDRIVRDAAPRESEAVAPAPTVVAAVPVSPAQAGTVSGTPAQEILVPIQLAIGDKSIRFDLRISLDLTAALAAAGAAAAPEEPRR